MSYVELKHRLADLTLEAVADPEAAAGWVPTLTEVSRTGEAASSGGGGVERLIQSGVVAREDDRVVLRQEFAAHRSYFQRHAARLHSFLTTYRTIAPPARIERPLWAGALLFNAGLYFECHELLEGLWKHTTGPEKNFLHGLVQAAACFYHYEKDNMHGARTLLEKALRRLEGYPSPYLSIDLNDFRNSLTRWQRRVVGSVALEEELERPVIRVTANTTRELRGGNESTAG